MEVIPIFIGYDETQPVSYHVCANSLIRHSSSVISLFPLNLNLIKGYKEQHVDKSNSFVYSRFLIPWLCNYRGWAIFIDGDMVVTDDITKLWEQKNEKFDVMVVKHEYKTKSPKKYLNNNNYDYPRKNWSSVILWNCESRHNYKLTPNLIENSTGSYLHQFKWLSDEKIGELPIEWNWLVDEFGPNNQAKILHYTLGTPCFLNYATGPMTDVWHKEKMLAMSNKEV